MNNFNLLPDSRSSASQISGNNYTYFKADPVQVFTNTIYLVVLWSPMALLSVPDDLRLLGSTGEADTTQPLIRRSIGEHDVIIKSAAWVDASRSGIPWPISALIIVNAALGAGLVNFPKAFEDSGGIVTATVVHIVLVSLAIGSLLILGWCSDIGSSENYQDTVGALCGPWFRRLCSGLIAVYCYGTCITFLVIVGDQSDRVFCDKFGKRFGDSWYFDRKFTVSVLSVLLILPLCYSRKIDFLRYASGVATIGVVYLVVVTVYVYFTTDTSNVKIKSKPSDWTDVFTVIPAICFGYQCHVSALPVYSSIQPHSIFNYTKAVSVALVICFISYTLVGVFGYLTYGSEITPDLLSSFPTQNVVVLIAFVIFAVKTFLTYPILLFCGRLAFDNLLVEIFGLDFELDEAKRRYVTATVWFTSSLCIALFVPSISIVINYLGCLAACFIFVFPGICLLNGVFIVDSPFPSFLTAKERVMVFIGSSYVIFGVFLLGLTLTQAIQSGITGHP